LGGGGMSEGYEVSSKRQRMIDPDPYFSGTSAFGPYGYGSGMPYLANQPRSFPVVRLRGLPFNCSDNDVCEFFAGLDVVDVLLVHKQGRFSGEGFVVFGAPMQVDFALQRDRQNMGRRYIEVFRCKKQDYYNAIAAEVNEPKGGDDAAPPSGYSKGSSDKDHMEHTGILKLRGLPFSVSKRDIIEFFTDYDLSETNVHIVSHSDGRATGEAFVEFSNDTDSKAAMSKDKMMIGTRYVELFPSTREEASRAASRSRH